MIISVLGTRYKVSIKSREQDKMLKNCDGYCDKTSKVIVVKAPDDEDELENYLDYQNKVMRHEVIHAFLFESGLSENWEHKPYGHDETAIDWFAFQFPKIMDVFRKLNCLR